MSLQVLLGEDEAHEVSVTRTPTGARVWVDGRAVEVALRPMGRCYELSVDDRTERVWIAIDGDAVYVHALGRSRRLEVVDPVEREQRQGGQGDTITAPTPGMVVSLAVSAGDAVQARDVLMVVEAMKMQSEITAGRDGVVERVHVEAGESFDRNAPLVALESVDGEAVQAA